MTQDAMKQALGALEDFVDVIKYDNEQDDIGRRACCDVLSYNPHSESCKAIKSIASLRQAIAELESQEPVAWRLESGKAVWLWFERTDPEANSALPNDVTAIPLYAHPPQRTWVGLTDEEIAEIGFESADRESAVIQTIDKLKQLNT
jgi:hypothetical protein